MSSVLEVLRLLEHETDIRYSLKQIRTLRLVDYNLLRMYNIQVQYRDDCIVMVTQTRYCTVQYMTSSRSNLLVTVDIRHSGIPALMR